MLADASVGLHSCNAPPFSILANALRMAEHDDDRELIRALAEWAKLSPTEVARQSGLTPSTLTRPLNHDVKHRLSTPTLNKLRAAFPKFPGWGEEPDLPALSLDIHYEQVDVLPTYAGMGGGGTGEGDVERALIPSYLIRNVLRGQPSDFVLIRVRGDSMEPVFRQDDELLVDKRDRSPTQPGPFALWDGEWGEYLVKNVERLPGGRVRIFSSNDKYTPVEVANEETNILGRPVWFGRRL
jgi:phage repressor protein C with HTH and peptisase S24 domain